MEQKYRQGYQNNNQDKYQKEKEEDKSFEPNFDTKWILNSIDDKAVEYACSLGTYLAPSHKEDKLAMTTSQIRNFFGEVKRIQDRVNAKGFDSEKAAFLLIRPKLAYAEARVTAKTKNSRIKTFRSQIEIAHRAVTTLSHFQNFVDILEAILAYHKAAGGHE